MSEYIPTTIAAHSAPALPSSGGMPISVPRKPSPRSYLTLSKYRVISLPQIWALGDVGALELFAAARWGDDWAIMQTCPKCGSSRAHYRVKSGAFKWKCAERLCRTQFTVFTDTPFHAGKLKPVDILAKIFHFVEAKDSISAREISGLFDVHHQTAFLLHHKIREALYLNMLASPKLRGLVQGDAAYFNKYRRPGNVGRNVSHGMKTKSKEAGLTDSETQPSSEADDTGKSKKAPKQWRHENMHALIIFFSEDEDTGERAFKLTVRKTEGTQADLLKIALDFCEPDCTIVTDEYSGYNLFGAHFTHETVNHLREFQNEDGYNTNLAEGVFARMRQAQSGAWHRVSAQHLELYGCEMAWRQTMIGRSNGYQMMELLKVIMHAPQSERFVCYGYPDEDETPHDPESLDHGFVAEVPKNEIKKRAGRKSKDRLKSAESPMAPPNPASSSAPEYQAGTSTVPSARPTSVGGASPQIAWSTAAMIAPTKHDDQEVLVLGSETPAGEADDFNIDW